MNIAEINNFHRLEPISVTPGQLVLDPNNPRINVDVTTQMDYGPEEILSERVQREILKKINTAEHHVADLINGIKTQGFLVGTTPIIVERAANTDKYVVLEGNRRTSAIKALLLNQNALSPVVLRTLEKIEVKEFTYLPNDNFERDEIVDILLGAIHITGSLAWGAMEKAFYIFRSYKRELRRTGDEAMRIDEPSVMRLSELFNSKPTDIRKSIWVYSVFEELREYGFNPDPKKFSLIEMAIANRRLRKEYFELSGNCSFSERGMARFSALCLENECPIRNPDDFNKFRFIFQQGSPQHLAELENGVHSLDDIHARVKEDEEISRNYDLLNDLLADLKAVNLFGAEWNDEELRVAHEIIKVVNRKIKPVIEFVENDESYRQLSLPSSVKELVEKTSLEKQKIIKDTLKTRPNARCYEDQLQKFVASYLSLRRTPYQSAEIERVVNKELVEMVDAGIVERYGNDRIRIRLLVD